MSSSKRLIPKKKAWHSEKINIINEEIRDFGEAITITALALSIRTRNVLVTCFWLGVLVGSIVLILFQTYQFVLQLKRNGIITNVEVINHKTLMIV